MKNFCIRSTIAGLAILIVSLSGWAAPSDDDLNLPPVPPSLSSPEREAFEAKRAEIQAKWDGNLAKKAEFLKQFAGTKPDTPQAAQAKEIRTALKQEADAIVDQADNFTERLGLATGIQALDVQIAESEKQLRGLGFKRAIPDFAWFAGQSGQARQHMINRLIGRVRDYAISKSEGLVEEHFLQYVQTMKPKEINKLADSLRRLGANEPLFQEWLRSFSPKLQRKVLVSGAKLAVDAVKREEKLFKIAENMDEGSVAAQQDAALTVISMITPDYPGLKELKLVATGAYDVLEAWATIAILEANIDELTTAVETQLANQKTSLLYRKDLIDRRKAAKQKLASLPIL